MNEVVREFLLETHENLAQLDLDLITLEKIPGEKETIARVFRTLHTVKGTAGFLGLEKLQLVAHASENLLSKVRAGELTFGPPIASAMLSTVDAIRSILTFIETQESEGDGDYSDLVSRLEALARGEVPPEPEAFALNLPEMTFEPLAPPTPPPPPAELPAPLVPTSVVHVPEPAPPPPPPPAATEPVEAKASTASVADSAIRVDVGLLDKLMNVVGELVLARNQLIQHTTATEDAALVGAVQRLNLLTTELQTSVMKTRMQPIGTVWSKFPRLVRDLAVACNKQVRFEMDGQETELDKTILEAIRDPLTHMVRNAVDHGIEIPDIRTAAGKSSEGRLRLHAFHESGKVVIEIVDDGGGIDSQKVRDKAVRVGLITQDQAGRMSERETLDLIFRPGFSTADKVTQFSGRGVGMDVVRTNIERIGGSVDLESRLGAGTAVRMKIPLTLAIIPALVVSAGGERFAIPQVSLLELVGLDRSSIESFHGAPVCRLRGSLLPLAFLDRELGLESMTSDVDHVMVVVLQADDRSFGLIVDGIHDTQEIVVKPLQQQLKGLNVYSGATIMGDGRVALILDVLGLAQRARVITGKTERARKEAMSTNRGEVGERISALLFAAPGGGRMAIPLNQVARLEEFQRSAIEWAGQQEVVQYRGAILPLVRVAQLLGDPMSDDDSPTVQAVVHSSGGRKVGLVIGRILDIVEETLTQRSPAGRVGVQFNAIIQGKVAEFLDLDAALGHIDHMLQEAAP